MTRGEFVGTWDRIKALWGGWAAGFNDQNEGINIDATYKLFRELSAAAVNEAVDQHFGEASGKKSGFAPGFGRIVELAKVIHYASRNADTDLMRPIHQTFISMLPRVEQLAREVEWYDRASRDEQVEPGERKRYEAIVILGRNQFARMGVGAKPADVEKAMQLEDAQRERALLWRHEAIAALQKRDADTTVREHTRAIPQAIARPSGARRKDSQSLGQVWK